MDKSERYLKEIAKNTADIVSELKKMNRKAERPKVDVKLSDSELENIRSAVEAEGAMQDALNNRN